MSDPAEQLQGSQQPGDGAGGTSTPSGETPEQEIARLKTENAQMREGRRKDRADALGATHGLTKTQIELLAGQPADKQEEIAKRLEEERKGTQQPAATTPPPATEPASQQQGTTAPANQPVVSAPPDPDENKQAAFSNDSGQTPPPVAKAPGGLQEQLAAEMAAAETFEEMQEIQQKYKNKAREERVARDRGQ